jgi:hypothetical protein
VAEADFGVNEIADRLNTLGAAGQLSKLRPGEIGELVAVAIPARDQEQQRFVGKVGNRRRPHIGWCFVRLARVLNDEEVGERDEPRRNFDARDPIAEKVEIRTHRQRGIGCDPIRGEQVGVPGRADAKLEDHRRRRRTFKRYLEPRVNQHGPLLAPSSAPAAIAAPSALAKACGADVKQYCGGVKPGKGAVADCIKSHASEVSDGCKDAKAKAEAGNK